MNLLGDTMGLIWSSEAYTEMRMSKNLSQFPLSLN